MMGASGGDSGRQAARRAECANRKWLTQKLAATKLSQPNEIFDWSKIEKKEIQKKKCFFRKFPAFKRGNPQGKSPFASLVRLCTHANLLPLREFQ